MIENHKNEYRITSLCSAFSVPKSTFYRSNRHKLVRTLHKTSPRRISEHEEAIILETLNSERFCDMSPGEIYATLLDEDTYLCSERTMYRILSSNYQNVQRRHSVRRNYPIPELLATKPNELWSWDITKLKSPQKWRYYYLYKIMDVVQSLCRWLDGGLPTICSACTGSDC